MVLHPVSSWTVAVVVATHERLLIVVLELLLERQRIELAAQGELPVHLLLGDVEVLDVKEAHFGDGVVQLLDEFLLAAGLVELAQVERDELGPVHCGNINKPHVRREREYVCCEVSIILRSSWVTGTCSYLSMILPGIVADEVELEDLRRCPWVKIY